MMVLSCPSHPVGSRCDRTVLHLARRQPERAEMDGPGGRGGGEGWRGQAAKVLLRHPGLVTATSQHPCKGVFSSRKTPPRAWTETYKSLILIAADRCGCSVFVEGVVLGAAARKQHTSSGGTDRPTIIGSSIRDARWYGCSEIIHRTHSGSIEPLQRRLMVDLMFF